MHAPWLQTSPAGHVFPHAPQFDGSDVVSTQTPPHATRPDGHAQVPFAHRNPGPQLRPHPPQLRASVASTTHPPPHAVVPAEQPPDVHAPLWHTSPSAQPIPQAPQLPGSTDVSAQSPPHAVWFAGHAHDPAEQIWSPLHAVLQPPQCETSDVTSRHPPSHALRPEPQAAAHVPLLQSAVAPPHDRPQAPQFAGLSVMSTHDAPQRTFPPAHAHVPSLQTSVEAQARSHDPQ